ncbi:LPS assembly lipoprotein LptE [Hyphomonas sp.]|uniref:LPS assembly lipoprotein LptE n=1 Tax=Hyphomonas sp. TaxID=87 RepID=UPI00391A9779
MRQLLALLLFAFVAACGFQPVYAPSGGAFVSAGKIEVAPISGREGHMLRRALLQELAAGLPGIEEPVTLTVSLNSNLSRLRLQPDGAASRSSVRANGNYRLQGSGTNLRGRVEVETGFLVPDSPYGDIAAQTSASDRAMRLLAKQIADDIRMKLAAS